MFGVMRGTHKRDFIVLVCLPPSVPSLPCFPSINALVDLVLRCRLQSWRQMPHTGMQLADYALWNQHG